MTMVGVARLLTALALVLAAPLAAHAKSPEIYTGSPEICTGLLSSTAAGGYDPVAYFTEGKPVAGKSGITHSWKGVTWRFASEKNRDLFKAKPEAYAPQYTLSIIRAVPTRISQALSLWMNGGHAPPQARLCASSTRYGGALPTLRFQAC